MNYAVGAVGPAGGIIIFDKGYYTNGWRFLEKGPEALTGSFGCENVYVQGTTLYFGDGVENTARLALACDGAARLCMEYTYDGFNDWFLPSFGEIEVISNYQNNELISSSEKNANEFFLSSGIGLKSSISTIIPVRRF